MSNESKVQLQKSKSIKKKNSAIFPKSPKITSLPNGFPLLSNQTAKELFKDSKKAKIQAALKFRKDSILSDIRRERTYSKLFEVVKCQPKEDILPNQN
jgi:hypothetical protein